MSAELPRPLPWSISDARSALVPIVLGFVLLAWAWFDASGTGKLADQTRSVVFALLGASAVVAGAGAWLAAGRRAVRVRRLAVIGVLEDRGMLTPAQAAAEVEPDTEGLVTVKGTSRYHRPDCLLVRDKSVQAFKPGSRRAGKREPCPMCRP